MKFECRFEYHPAPGQPQSYISPLGIDVLCANQFDEQLVARLAFDHLELDRVEENSENLWEVCDSDSDAWATIYKAMFRQLKNGNILIKDELDFSEVMFDVLFLYRAVFHPAIMPWRSFILNSAFSMLDYNSVTITWEETLEMSMVELSRLGFRRIPGHRLLLSPNMVNTPYRAEQADADWVKVRTLDLDIDEDRPDYVETEWNRPR